MWGHYAAAERGFVVVYTTDNGTIRITTPIKSLYGSRPLPEKGFRCFELGNYNEDSLELKSVKYGKRPPRANAFHRLIPRFSYSEMEDHYDVPSLLHGDAKNKKEDQVGLVKFSDWRYEQEVRAFLPVSPRYNELPPDMRVMSAAPENICGLIFGPRMSEQDRMRAVLCCHHMRASLSETAAGLLPPFMFFEAMQVFDRYDFKVVPVGTLGGQHFALLDGILPLQTINDLDVSTCQSLRETSDQIEKGLQNVRAGTKLAT